MKLLCCFLFIFFFVPASVNSDVFRLKNGEVIEGEFVREDGRSIVIKIKYGTVTVDRAALIEKEPVHKEVKPKTIRIAPRHEKIMDKNVLKNIPEKDLQNMHRWLAGQIHPKTGLLESFRPTADIYLEKQASTYDQALAGLSFLISDDAKKAQALLDFYKAKWNGNGFSNFYFTPTGNPGIEYTVHLGPNMWIAILALHYDRMTGAKRYQGLAENIVKWAMKLPHYRGGAAMSYKDEWRAQWSRIVSTENNIDYFAVLDILEDRVSDSRLKEEIRKEKLYITDFLKNTACDRKTGAVNRGFHQGIVDKERALDTVSWLVAAVGIDRLRTWGIDTERLIAFTEKRFLVRDGDVKGFDFTDRKGAYKAGRDRMISAEWTLAMVNVYCIYKSYYERLAVEQYGLGHIMQAKKMDARAGICRDKASYYLKEMDKLMLKFGISGNLCAYPYATKSYWLVFFDSPWWKTPKADINGTPAGSVASTSWRIFAGRFNPLRYNGDVR